MINNATMTLSESMMISLSLLVSNIINNLYQIYINLQMNDIIIAVMEVIMLTILAQHTK